MLSDDERELLLRLVESDCAREDQERALGLLQSNSEARAFLKSVSEQAVLIADIERMSDKIAMPTPTMATVRQEGRHKAWSTLAIAASLLIATALGWFLQSFLSRERFVAQVTGINGVVSWTGDAGQIVSDLQIGQKLTGGTLEGMSPDAWFEIEFNDKSKVGVSGNSRVTFSDLHQKELHLHAGAISADVTPQPLGRPMLVHTRTATFEVLGTQLLIESELASSTLSVIEGSVKATRLIDNQSIEVLAQHRVTAAYDKRLTPEKLPLAVDHWASDLGNGGVGSFGRWNVGSNSKPASLSAIPYNFRMPDGQVLNLFAAAFEPDYSYKSPIKLSSNSVLKLRAQMSSLHYLICGVTMRQNNGQFAGNFYVTREPTGISPNEPFEIEMKFTGFQLASSLEVLKRDLPNNPADLFIESIWFHTMEQNAGLEIYEVSVLADETK